MPLEVILARMERAVGEYAMKLIRRDLSFGETTGNQAAIEEWGAAAVETDVFLERIHRVRKAMGLVLRQVKS